MWAKVIVVTFICVLANHLVQLFWFFGLYKQLHNHKPGLCHTVYGIENGSEDLTTLSDGLTFITSGFREEYAGRMHSFNFNNPEMGSSHLQITGDFNETTFHPHGLSALDNKETGIVTLFVINHTPDQENVEVFRYSRHKPTKLQHVKTISDPTFRMGNDLVATGGDTFYLTNDFWWTFPWNYLEVFGLFKWGTVVYYDGHNGTVVLDGIHSPNGINVSPDQKYLYLADFLGNVLKVYRRESHLQLTELQTISLYSAPDNIEVDPNTGDLWIGSHLSLGKIYTLKFDKQAKAPSQVFHVKIENGLVQDITEVYADRGQQLSGSSVAAFYKGQLLVGTVYHKLLYCKLDTPNP